MIAYSTLTAICSYLGYNQHAQLSSHYSVIRVGVYYVNKMQPLCYLLIVHVYSFCSTRNTAICTEAQRLVLYSPEKCAGKRVQTGTRVYDIVCNELNF